MSEEKEIQHTKEELDKIMTEKQKNFCHEYVVEWNGSKSYKKAYAGTTDDTARVNACKLLTKTNIKQYVDFIKNDFEMLCGISKTKNLNELSKIAYSSITHLHNTWIELTDWETIKAENPKCMDAIESIDTKTETKAYNNGEKSEINVETKYIKIKLYSKPQAIQEINKMMGYNEPERMEVKTESTDIPIPIIKTNAKIK